MTFWLRVVVLIFCMAAVFMLFAYLFPFPEKKK